MVEYRKVSCTSRILMYELHRKNVKNINIRIKQDGTVFVSAGRFVNASQIDQLIMEKQGFIIHALEQYEKKNQDHPDLNRELVLEEGQQLSILGQRLILRIQQQKMDCVLIKDGYLILSVRNTEDMARRERVMKHFLTKLTQDTFQEICESTYPEFGKMGISYPVIKIRKMKSRWGSCQPIRGIVTLNSRLIEMPKPCIEYVVLHEFAHLVHPNHSKDFYDFIKVRMPDYKERKRKLDELG